MNYRSIHGKSVFPLHPEVRPDMDPKRCGITMRDWFAAKAMQGLCANGMCANGNTNAIDIARAAYIIADAMLEAGEA
jgi:hypothetical protein